MLLSDTLSSAVESLIQYFQVMSLARAKADLGHQHILELIPMKSMLNPRVQVSISEK